MSTVIDEATLKTLRLALRAFRPEQSFEESDAQLSEFVRSVKADAWDLGAHFQATLAGRQPVLEANPYRSSPVAVVVDVDQPTLDLEGL